MESNAMDILREAGFDVDAAMGRLMNNQAFYVKMLDKFAKDTNFDKLRGLVQAGDIQGAGEVAHAIKGVASTLGMTRLSELCSTLQHLYQGREQGDPSTVFAQADQEYEQAMAALRKVLP